MTEKVLVSLDDSTDSIVAAWLLKRQGFQLKGIYFDLQEDVPSEAESTLKKISMMERVLTIPIQQVKCGEEAKELIKKEVELLSARGFHYDISVLYYRKFLLPRLFNLKDHYSMDRVATGFRIDLNHEPMNQMMKVNRHVSAGQDQCRYLLGLGQKELLSLVFPLGNIPSSMIEKLTAELELKNTQEPLKALLEIKPEIPLKTTQEDRLIQELWLDEAHWFSGVEPGFTPKICMMSWETGMNPIKVKLIQFEGSTIKAFPEVPIHLLKSKLSLGDEILWIDHENVMGGARVVNLI